MPPLLKPELDETSSFGNEIADLKPITDQLDKDWIDQNGNPNKEKPGMASSETKPYQIEIVWRNVILMSLIHLSAFYGLYLCFGTAKWQTIVAAMVLYMLSGIGITGGAHRLWSHRAYKARFPLRLFLAFLQTMAFQNHIYEWSRDHRVHHKYSETDADPHNANRGFFFAHVGWLLCRKHPDVIKKGSSISMDDLLRDPIVAFQRKYYLPLVVLCCFVLPTLLPLLWGETLWNAYFICVAFRYVWTLHMTWLVNSAAHFWGRRPYDKNINPAENLFTVYFAFGEGFHNYHHTFPWDYSTSELGWRFNTTTMFINLMEKLGQVYDLKRVSPDMIVKRKIRTGDIHQYGNYGLYHPNPMKALDGDQQQPSESEKKEN